MKHTYSSGYRFFVNSPSYESIIQYLFRQQVTRQKVEKVRLLEGVLEPYDSLRHRIEYFSLGLHSNVLPYQGWCVLCVDLSAQDKTCISNLFSNST